MISSIILGGGCFWCIEATFQMFEGIKKITSGYAGGDRENPRYETVCTGNTGHAEVIELQYESDEIKLEKILAVFFTSHDPTTQNRQGNDVGSQYRSIILYTTDEQKKEIDKFINQLTADKIFPNPIVTEVKKLEKFYEAENYHQNYYRNNIDKPYCQVVINPKLNKIREIYRSAIL